MTRAENNSNGIGSIFYFTLPIVKTSGIAINGKWCPITTTKKILVIDDEPDVTYTIKNILNDVVFQIDCFNDSIMALKS